LKEIKEKEIATFDHPVIRDEEACLNHLFKKASQLAKSTSRLHSAIITRESNQKLFSNMLPRKKFESL